MAGSSVLFPWSSIALDSHLEFLTRSERHHAAGGNRNLLARLGITPRSLVLLSQVEIAETRQLHLLPFFQRFTDHLEIGVHELFCLTLIEAYLEKEALGHLCFGQRHLILATSPCMP